MLNKTKTQKKAENLLRRKRKVRSLVSGTADRPRLMVNKSNRYTEASLIDDVAGRTLLTLNTLKIKVKPAEGELAKVAVAYELGKQISALASDLKITTVVFDRRGYQYFGRIKAVAEGAREAGLKF